MSTPALVPNYSFNSQKSARTRPEPQSESERLKLLLDLTNTLVSSLECRDLLRTVSATIRQVMQCDTVGVWLPDAEQVDLRQLAMDFPGGRGFITEDLLQAVDNSVLGTVFKSGKPLILAA